MSLWTSNMSPPPWIFLSFLYTLYGQVSGKSSEVAIELLILVSWIATTCGWWKSRKATNSSFLPLMLLIFMLMNFIPLIKLLLFVPQGEDLSFVSFVRGTNLFSVSKFTCSPKKESEKLKNSHFGQIHVQFVLFTVPYWVSAMNDRTSDYSRLPLRSKKFPIDLYWENGVSMLVHSFLIESSWKLLVTSTGIKAQTSWISGLWFPWLIYMFF